MTVPYTRSAGRSPTLADLDAALIELDGTATKSRLGANAIVGVSMATARGVAVSAGGFLADPGRC